MELNIETLFSKAKETLENYSYSPYSKFKVGAAILTEHDLIFVGTNIENASYSLAQCAESVAIAHMICQGESYIKAILVTSDATTVCTPCGACRQRIAEFGDDNTMIYMCDDQKVVEKKTLNALLPNRFDKNILFGK